MKFFFGFAIGVALGTVFAPASGAETRQWVKNQAENAARMPKRKLREVVTTSRKKAGDLGARVGREAAESAVQAVENRIVGETGTE